MIKYLPFAGPNRTAAEPVILFQGYLIAFGRAVIAVTCLLALNSAASAERLISNVAVFSALDKVTARISRIEVPIDKTVVFGSLKVTPRVCYSRPVTERPKTSSFVEVDEIQLDGAEKRIFSGWMFAESPGLNAVEHPVFNVWLSGCGKPIASTAARTRDRTSGVKSNVQPETRSRRHRRRVRR